MTTTPRRIKTPKPCRYCGFVADTHHAEHKAVMRSAWYCRNADECGDRIRANKRAAGIPEDKSDTPF